MAQKKTLITMILMFVCSSMFCLISAQSAEAKDFALLAGTTGKQIYVREYRIASSGEWSQLRDLLFPARGLVIATSMTPPDSSGEFSIYYTYWSQQEIHARNVRIDQKKFKVITDTPLKTGGSYIIATFQASTTAKNNQRLVFEDKEDLVMQKIQTTSGKPFLKKTKFFDHAGFPLQVSFSSSGTNVAMLHLDEPVGDLGAIVLTIFQSLSKSGKPIGEASVFKLTHRMVDSIAAGAGYDWPDDSRSYAVATRERNTGNTQEAGVFLTRFDATTNQPIDGPVTVSPYGKTTQRKYEAIESAVWIYDLPARENVENSRSWVVYEARVQNCKKPQIVSKQFHPRTLEFGVSQTLIGCNDEILKKGRYFKSISGVTYQN